MATAKSYLILIVTILLLIKTLNNYFTPLSQHYNFPSPNQVYTKVVLNLAFLKSKQHYDDAFPAIASSYSHRSANHKTLPIPLPPPALFNIEKDVVALREKNFINLIENNQRVMVIFYTSEWRVAPEHAAICMQLTGASVAAKVDFNEEKMLASRYKIVRYPSVYYFPGGALGDKYYSEVFLEVDSRKLVEGKFRGTFVGRSNGNELENEKNEDNSVTNQSNWDVERLESVLK